LKLKSAQQIYQVAAKEVEFFHSLGGAFDPQGVSSPAGVPFVGGPLSASVS